jgi:hypothetical protein
MSHRMRELETELEKFRRGDHTKDLVSKLSEVSLGFGVWGLGPGEREDEGGRSNMNPKP